jgi:hypothetical protein
MKHPENKDWIKYSPYDRYNYFIASKIDRYKALLATIEKLNLNSAVISIADSRHIFIFPSGVKSLRATNGIFPYRDGSLYLLCAHYDRVQGSPGANDNSMAVFHLLSAALTLYQRRTERWIMVFTDNEEIGPGESFESQGSFALAEKIKSWGLEKAKIFNFDACGTGDTFIISTTTDHILKNSDSPNILKVRNSIGNLRDHALETANYLRLDKVLLAPTPFSDDVGFLRAGLASQTITMLPAAEAEKYEILLRNRSEFVDLIISGGIKAPAERRNLPETWRNLNTPADTPDRLTPQFFDQVVRFIVEIIK